MCDNLPPFEEDRRALRPDLGLYQEVYGSKLSSGLIDQLEKARG